MSSYARQSQSKAQNEANARTLRAIVKQLDNKVCADCKRNDPRWASWNIGCFLCIRCSGIHRSMGTHISKVKSIDLDIWTPEQMASIQQWGNKRCNLYWEAHLKAGHIPPEHKVESFIRSKYETRRWAKDGPVPSDPSMLEEGGTTAPAGSTTSNSTSSPSSSRPSRAPAPSAVDLLGGDIGPASATTSVSNPSSSLLDGQASKASGVPSPPVASPTGRTAAVVQKPAVKHDGSAGAGTATASGGGGGGLFDLDWHSGPTSPSTASSASQSKGSKNDILSLFSSTSPRPPAPAGLDAFGNLSLGGGQAQTGSTNNPWGMPAQSQPQANTSRAANVFGTQDVWGGPAPSTSAVSTAAAPSLGNDIWGEMTSGSSRVGSSMTQSGQSSQNDAFADIWK